MSSKKKIYEIGDLVFAKVRGYPAWPARISSVGSDPRNIKYHVFFFGTYETATIRKEDIWDFNKATKSKYAGKGSMKRKGFAQGMFEIENTPNIACAEDVVSSPKIEEIPTAETTETKDPSIETEVGENDDVLKVEEESSVIEDEYNDESKDKGKELEISMTPKEPSEENKDNTNDGGKNGENSEYNAKDDELNEDEENPLVINEDVISKNNTTKYNNNNNSSSSSVNNNNSTNSTAATKGNRKRKLEDVGGVSSPPPPKKRVPPSLPITPASTEVTTATVSRSGRVIKPKKFVDDDDDKEHVLHNEITEKTASPIPLQNSKESSSSNKPVLQGLVKEPRKMWVEVKSTGDMIEINLDKDKPKFFESKESELQWEKATARNALKFKERVESGDFIPDEVRVKLEGKNNRSEEEENILKKARRISLRMEKIRWLRVEQKIVDIDIAIKTSLNVEKPDIQRCLKALQDFDSMAIAPLMLKKQPEIVTTIRKLFRYVGPLKDAIELSSKAEKVRKTAQKIYSKLRSIFSIDEDTDFTKVFENIVLDFKNATKGMELSKVIALVSDPTKKIKKKVK